MTVAELRNLFDEARPLVKQWLDLSEQFSAFRLTATEKGLDWSQIKALLKAQTQDERDGGNEHVRRIIERAEYASSYAAQLGLMNENNYSDEPPPTTVLIMPKPAAPVKAAAEESGAVRIATSPSHEEDGADRKVSLAAGSRHEPVQGGPVVIVNDTAWQMQEPIPANLRRVG